LIEVTNPDHVSKGVQKLVVDGVPIPGNLIPAFDDGKPHTVEVTLGALAVVDEEAAQ
jgi:cellobiose phosphorylase